MEKKMEIKERRSLEQKETRLIQNSKLPSNAVKSREKECGSNESSHSFLKDVLWNKKRLVLSKIANFLPMP